MSIHKTGTPKVNKNKEEIFTIIYEYSQDGNGISLEELQQRTNVSENKLRKECILTIWLWNQGFIRLKKIYTKVIN